VLSQQGQELLKSYRRPILRTGVDPDPPRLIRGFKRVVLHPDRAQTAQESLKLYARYLACSKKVTVVSVQIYFVNFDCGH
jgi:hypothetical protein